MDWNMAMEYALIRSAQRGIRYHVRGYQTFIGGRMVWRYGTTAQGRGR